MAVLMLLLRHLAHTVVRNELGKSSMSILGVLWPRVLEWQGEDIQSARVLHLRCLAARLASGVKCSNSVPANVSLFIYMHSVQDFT